MRRAIGISTAEHFATGLVEGHQLSGSMRIFREDSDEAPLLGMPPSVIAEVLADEAKAAAGDTPVDAVGIGLPGIIRDGLVEESPNLPQLKGANMRVLLTESLANRGMNQPVFAYNDADILAAGLAAMRGQLDLVIRVWSLGYGVGFGFYPWHEGIWEGGHSVVSLDPSERYCGCGGRGHLEGIMGHRAMRLRFLDMEPDEVFDNARQGDPRCVEFVKLWHAALAAATSSSIHFVGPGKFYITGFNARHLDVNLLNQYMHEMVKMSTLQSYVFEVVPSGDEIAVVGAAVNALRAVFPG